MATLHQGDSPGRDGAFPVGLCRRPGDIGLIGRGDALRIIIVRVDHPIGVARGLSVGGVEEERSGVRFGNRESTKEEREDDEGAGVEGEGLSQAEEEPISDRQQPQRQLTTVSHTHVLSTYLSGTRYQKASLLAREQLCSQACNRSLGSRWSGHRPCGSVWRSRCSLFRRMRRLLLPRRMKNRINEAQRNTRNRCGPPM